MGMIQKTVYFRTKEDLDLYNALPNKAEWLHEHLTMGVYTIKPNNDPPKVIHQTEEQAKRSDRIVPDVGHLSKPVRRRERDVSMEPDEPRVHDDVDWGA